MTQTRRDGTGTCESCGYSFDYMLIHNGFNDSAFAYCDSCGMTALFFTWSAPQDTDIGRYGPITPYVDERAERCTYGGRFLGSAAPRCPSCRQPLSAERAAEYIERYAPAAPDGWRWQRSWQGLYAIVIEGRFLNDPWHDSGAHSNKNRSTD